jgi:hypothetical protein
MDQLLSVPSATAVAVTGNMGALVTFARFPKYMTGVIVKVRPTYDADFGQDPYLEYWTYDGVAAAWALRRSVALSNGFEGVQSGRLKYFDFRTDARLENVTAVWITLNEGAVAGSTLSWFAVHVFGACDKSTAGGGGGGGTIDTNDPGCTSSDCIDPDPCEGQPESCAPTEDTCRELAIQYGYDPDICELTPDPDWNIPEFPLIDFCDPVAMAAFRATLTPLQLSWLEELLAAVELPCLDPEDNQPDEISPINEDPDLPGDPLLPAQPIEEYVDPEDLNTPGTDPDPRAADEPSSGGGGAPIEYVMYAFAGAAPGWPGVQPGGTFRAWWVTMLAGTNFEEETIATYAIATGPLGDVIETTNGTPYTGLRLTFTGASAGTVVNIRGIRYGVSGSIDGDPITNYISDQIAMDGDTPPGGDITIDTTNGVFATQNPIAGANYFRFNRTGVGEVDFLELAYNPANFGGTGSALNWGSGIMLRIIATPPSGTVSVVPTFVVI